MLRAVFQVNSVLTVLVLKLIVAQGIGVGMMREVECSIVSSEKLTMVQLQLTIRYDHNTDGDVPKHFLFNLRWPMHTLG